MRSFWSPSSLAGIVLAALLASLAMALDDPPLLLAKRQPVRPIGGKTTPVADTTVSDEEALKAAGLTAEDGPKLVEYLVQRTLSDTDQGKIAGIIKRLGADDFDDRVKATEEIEIFGPAAVGPLKTAERDNDPEIAYRARIVLKKMAKVPHSAARCRDGSSHRETQTGRCYCCVDWVPSSGR